MPRSAVQLGVIGVTFSVERLMSMFSCRQVHTILLFDACQWAANGRVGPGEFQHLYGAWRAAATHKGMSPDCSKLGLGVWKISIAAGTGEALATLLS